MNDLDLENYNSVRSGKIGFYEQKRGLIAVSGKEAVQFLNGLITNDVAKLKENEPLPAAFPNAQGRLIAVVRVLRRDGKFLFETEAATHEKVFQNLFRFTFAGDFFVEDRSEKYTYFSMTNDELRTSNGLEFLSRLGRDVFVPIEEAADFLKELEVRKAVEVGDELYEVLRIEGGIPLYGVDMDETTIVPELGFDGLISYNKGCYIGQEIIARIHFRGHIAKQLTGLIFEDESASVNPGDELKSADGKNAGKITSVTFSPKLAKTIALAFVRYDYLAEGTELKAGDLTATVKNLPFVE
jgi:folate-binding protein YgfZ